MPLTFVEKNAAIVSGENYSRMTRKQMKRARKQLNRTLHVDIRRQLEWNGYVDVIRCPEHGWQLVIDEGESGPAHDPYGAQRGNCGCWIVCMGPADEDIHIVSRQAVKTFHQMAHE